MVIIRHKDFATTRKFYGAKRAAQAAAAEIHLKLVVGDHVDTLSQPDRFTPEQVKKLKQLLKSIE